MVLKYVSPGVNVKRLSIVLFIVLLCSIPVAISLGSTDISPQQVLDVLLTHFGLTNDRTTFTQGVGQIIWELRLPRVLMACLTGAGLALAGLTLQTITGNALADPHLLGISSGAVLGAVIVTMHTGNIIGQYTLPIAAFTGALLATLIILLVNQSRRMQSANQLLMCGVALSFVLTAVANFALYAGDTRASHQVIFWLLGDLGTARWGLLWIPGGVCLLTLICLSVKAQSMNALLLGDETAASMGIPVKRLRLQLFVLSALVTAVIVANTGAIGFVGLMVPHIARYFTTGNIRQLIPVSALLGGLLLIWLDVISRVLLKPEELPIGIMTGFIGGLFFIFLLLRGKR